MSSRTTEQSHSVGVAGDVEVWDTLAIAEEEGLHVHLLPSWYDVDDAASLGRLREELVVAPERVAIHTRSFLS